MRTCVRWCPSGTPTTTFWLGSAATTKPRRLTARKWSASSTRSELPCHPHHHVRARNPRSPLRLVGHERYERVARFTAQDTHAAHVDVFDLEARCDTRERPGFIRQSQHQGVLAHGLEASVTQGDQGFVVEVDG